MFIVRNKQKSQTRGPILINCFKYEIILIKKDVRVHMAMLIPEESHFLIIASIIMFGY